MYYKCYLVNFDLSEVTVRIIFKYLNYSYDINCLIEIIFLLTIS